MIIFAKKSYLQYYAQWIMINQMTIQLVRRSNLADQKQFSACDSHSFSRESQ